MNSNKKRTPVDGAAPKRVPLQAIEGRHDGTRAVFHPDLRRRVPIFQGRGDTDFLCGKCGSVLAERIFAEQLGGILLKCYNCDSYNERNLA